MKFGRTKELHVVDSAPCGVSFNWRFYQKNRFFLFVLNSARIRTLLKNTKKQSFVFLVGTFSFKEKSPTITVASFFFFFFLRPHCSSRMYHFLQKLIRLLRPSQANGNLVQRVPLSFFTFFYVTYETGRDQRVPPFNFFRHCAKFFSKIF